MFLTHLTIYGCFELVLSSCSFLIRFPYHLLPFEPTWSPVLHSIDPVSFSVLRLPLLTLALIQTSYLHTYTWFHFCCSFSPDCVVHILANRGGGEPDKTGGKPSVPLITIEACTGLPWNAPSSASKRLLKSLRRALMNQMYIVIDDTYVNIDVCSIRKVRIEFGVIWIIEVRVKLFWAVNFATFTTTSL